MVNVRIHSSSQAGVSPAKSAVTIASLLLPLLAQTQPILRRLPQRTLQALLLETFTLARTLCAEVKGL